ncbi:hypothetical protein GHT06_014551 [Daphnia sinensis]|uniref:Uncharacterized protein n=1 Tax=Daphnia sinensis TaxID=1820382 RepID=A0AAD5KQ20_9CRUS|nr:hypothetical protein GHT06_014551 [Daphnia sinensis]
MLVQEMTLFVVVCVAWQVNGLPFISHSKQTGTEDKAQNVLDNWKSYHIFPHWVAEIGEICLFAIDFVWHHELTEHIQEVGSEVSEINSKLDAILATSPAASRLFSQLKKSSHHPPPDENFIWDYQSSTPTPTIQQQVVRWKKRIADDNNIRSNVYTNGVSPYPLSV